MQPLERRDRPQNIVLVGDSIFDNAPYVSQGEDVSTILSGMISGKVTLLARDGDISTDIASQLNEYPSDTTHLFLSVGGNDALQSALILEKPVFNIASAMKKMYLLREEFRANYSSVLNLLVETHKYPVVCTIYNKVPLIPHEALTALALFNEVILEEATARKLPIIDLRTICDETEDYSEVSPIEPSFLGGKKIAGVITSVIGSHDFNRQNSIVYS